MFGKADVVGGRGRKEAATKFGGGNPRVRVLLSNLAATVNTADLEVQPWPFSDLLPLHFWGLESSRLYGSISLATTQLFTTNGL